MKFGDEDKKPNDIDGLGIITSVLLAIIAVLAIMLAEGMCPAFRCLPTGWGF